ncbi:uncharacterized protein LOC100212495 isoform X1 [Hydra vulgaris]|uniref:uncharacterized protein LOC100212495 isoform X1 n=1 Tax=Hydra vulgaris TaxID=6087 RepID=UPI001F5EF240|nr:uncharacterized protein LOC100212495 [Hydra vulgaris]
MSKKKNGEIILKIISLITVMCIVTTNGKLFIGDCSYGFCNQLCKTIDEGVIECFCRKGFILQKDGRNCIFDQDDNQLVESIQISGDGESLENCDDSDGICESFISNIGSGENNDILETFEQPKESLVLSSLLNNKYTKGNSFVTISSSSNKIVNEKIIKFSNVNPNISSTSQKKATITTKTSISLQSTTNISMSQQPTPNISMSQQSTPIISMSQQSITNISMSQRQTLNISMSRQSTPKISMSRQSINNSYKNFEIHTTLLIKVIDVKKYKTFKMGNTSYESQETFQTPIHLLNPNTSLFQNANSLTGYSEKSQFKFLLTESGSYQNESSEESTSSNTVMHGSFYKITSKTQLTPYKFQTASSNIHASPHNISEALSELQTPWLKTEENLFKIQATASKIYAVVSKNRVISPEIQATLNKFQTTPFEIQATASEFQASIPFAIKKTPVFYLENLTTANFPNKKLSNTSTVNMSLTPVQSKKYLLTEILQNSNDEQHSSTIVLKKTPILFKENYLTELFSNSNYIEAAATTTIERTPLNSLVNLKNKKFSQENNSMEENATTVIDKNPDFYQENFTIKSSFYPLYTEKNTDLTENIKTPVPFQNYSNKKNIDNLSYIKENKISVIVSEKTAMKKMTVPYKKKSKIISLQNLTNKENLMIKETPRLRPESRNTKNTFKPSYAETKKTTLIREKLVPYQIKSKVENSKKAIVFSPNNAETTPITVVETVLFLENSKIESIFTPSNANITSFVNTFLSSTSLYFIKTGNVSIANEHKSEDINQFENVVTQFIDPKTNIVNEPNTFKSSSSSIHQFWVINVFIILLAYIFAVVIMK